MNIFNLDLNWLRKNLAPRNLDQQLLCIALHNLNRRSQHTSQKSPESVFFELDILLRDAAIPLVDHDVLRSKLLQIRQKGD